MSKYNRIVSIPIESIPKKKIKKAGMDEAINNIGDDKRHGWKIEDNNIENILKRMEKAKDIIIKEYDLEPEEDEEKIFAYTLKARYKMKNLTEKEFKKWLKQEKKDYLIKRTYSSFFYFVFIIIIMRVFLYIISYIFMIIGLTFIMLYINLFSFGYTIFEYLEFIFTNIECLLFFIGFIILLILLWR